MLEKMVSLGYPNRQVVRPGSGPRSVCMCEWVCLHTQEPVREGTPRVSEVSTPGKVGRYSFGPEPIPGRRDLTEHSRLTYREEAPGLFPRMASLCKKNVTAGEGGQTQPVSPGESPPWLRGWSPSSPPPVCPLPCQPVFSLVQLLPLAFLSRVSSQHSPQVSPSSFLSPTSATPSVCHQMATSWGGVSPCHLTQTWVTRCQQPQP